MPMLGRFISAALLAAALPLAASSGSDSGSGSWLSGADVCAKCVAAFEASGGCPSFLGGQSTAGHLSSGCDTCKSAAEGNCLSKFKRAKASFGAHGEINFVQRISKHNLHDQHKHMWTNTTIHVKLTGLEASAGPFSWHVHVLPVTAGGCGATGGHYNTAILKNTGELANKHGKLIVVKTKTTARFTDTSLTLFGSSSIMGRSIVLHKKDSSRYICATVADWGGVRTAEAWFGANPRGRVVLTQGAEDGPTVIETSLGQLAHGPNPWHVHERKVSTPGDCSAKATGGHYNPTTDAGELSKKHGDLKADSKGAYSNFSVDYGVKLFGAGSVLGRSIVLHKQSDKSRWACATINPTTDTSKCAQCEAAFKASGGCPSFMGDGTYESHTAPGCAAQCGGAAEGNCLGKFGRVHADFGAHGQIRLVQLSSKHNLHDQHPHMWTNTTINVKLTGLNASAGPFSWHVHVLPVTAGGCGATGGHYNTKILNNTGELADKHGKLPAKTDITVSFTDTSLTLFGSSSVAGRSIVIHDKSGGRILCATLSPMSGVALKPMDCAGNASGTAKADKCGVCSGPGKVSCKAGGKSYQMCGKAGSCPKKIVKSSLDTTMSEVTKDRPAFEAKFKSGLAKVLGVPARRIAVAEIVAGSVVVSWYVTEDSTAGAPTPAELTQKFEQKVKSAGSAGVTISGFKVVSSASSAIDATAAPTLAPTAAAEKGSPIIIIVIVVIAVIVVGVVAYFVCKPAKAAKGNPEYETPRGTNP